jgi:hypothetical protein
METNWYWQFIRAKDYESVRYVNETGQDRQYVVPVLMYIQVTRSTTDTKRANQPNITSRKVSFKHSKIVTRTRIGPPDISFFDSRKIISFVFDSRKIISGDGSTLGTECLDRFPFQALFYSVVACCATNDQYITYRSLLLLLLV